MNAFSQMVFDTAVTAAREQTQSVLDRPWLLDQLQVEWETMMLNLDDAQAYLDQGRDDLCRNKIEVVRQMLEKRKARHAAG